MQIVEGARARRSIVRRSLRATQEAALPALYACLQFKSVASLQQFLNTVHAATAEGRDVACHIRSFTMPDSASLAAPPWRDFSLAMAGLPMVLIHASNLRAHETSGMIALTALPILSVTCPDTLQHLRIALRWRATHAALTCLHVFRALLTLDVVMAEDGSGSDPPPILVMPAWSFAHLTVFSFSARGEFVLSQQMVAFLNTCRLPSLRWLKMSTAIGSADTAQAFADFCARPPLLEQLDLRIDKQWYPFLVPAMFVQVLRVEDPDEALAAHLTPAVRHLYLTSRDFLPAFYAHLWTVLDGVLTRRPGVEDVHLPPRFSWARDVRPAGEPTYVPAPHEDTNLPQLLRYAILFQKSGIGLRDGQGNTLADYLH
jgi:hypothetical protein